MLQLPPALQPLSQYNQFIIWTIRPVNGILRKLPIDYRDMRTVDAHNPLAQSDFTTISQICAALGSEYHVGFVLTAADPFFFIDVDKCWDGKEWLPLAGELSAVFDGAAKEVSHSGTGYHIIGTGICPPHGCKNSRLGLELYTEKRFIALTGINTTGSAAANCSSVLPDIVQKYFTPSAGGDGLDTLWTTEPVEGYSSTETDEELINRALASTSAGALLGGKASFKDLWTADPDSLSRNYPDTYNTPPREYDASNADAALAQHLMFWTGGNCERVEQLMRMSALVRDKWDRSGDDYLGRTILRAAGNQKNYYSIRTVPPNPYQNITPPQTQTTTPSPAKSTVGYQYLNTDIQKEYFAGCVYVQDIHKIFTLGGDLLDMGRFNAMYGGYVFQIDEIGDKTTRKAWEAFTENQAVRFPKVQGTCFRPALAPGEIINENGRSLVNSFVPMKIDFAEGDPTPFLIHLKKVLPVAHDQKVLLSYMAACIQHQGVKFQWAPLLQGTEGNGKTLFTRCVEYAIGKKYSHMPPAHEISEKFNGWLFNKTFIGIEDVYVAENRREIIEVLKPMITNERLAMREMQQTQVMGDNYANFMLNSNHSDAIRKTMNDRRFAVFFTAQQVSSDLTRDGMDGEYFPRLYAWLRDKGYAIVANYLKNYKIEEKYNPATLCHRAPETSSTDAAIAAGMGRIEQEIMEAVEEERAGFCKGWISSVALERLLKETRQSKLVPINKRREVLQSLGYDYHPALSNGRSNVPIAGDEGKKPRIFIKQGHLYRNIAGANNVTRQYQIDQGFIVGAESVVPGPVAAASSGR